MRTYLRYPLRRRDTHLIFRLLVGFASRPREIRLLVSERAFKCIGPPTRIPAQNILRLLFLLIHLVPLAIIIRRHKQAIVLHRKCRRTWPLARR
jgi:hypothetical protein